MACNGHSWEPLADIEEKPARLPDQIEVAYTMLRQGYTEVEIRLAIQAQFGKAAKPTQAFRRGLDLVVQEQREARQHLPELVMALRWRAIQQGLATGQLGAVAGMLRDAGAACGEAALDAAGATLTVQVLEPGAGQNTTAPAQQLQEAA
jgi:hypothetical protein